MSNSEILEQNNQKLAELTETLSQKALSQVPAGGTTDQILAKASDADYDTKWVDAPSGGTTVTVKGKAVETFDADTKVSKIGKQSYAQVYYQYTNSDGSLGVAGWKVNGSSGIATNNTYSIPKNNYIELKNAIKGNANITDFSAPCGYVDDKVKEYIHHVTYKAYHEYYDEQEGIDEMVLTYFGEFVIRSKSATLIDNNNELNKYTGQYVEYLYENKDGLCFGYIGDSGNLVGRNIENRTVSISIWGDYGELADIVTEVKGV